MCGMLTVVYFHNQFGNIIDRSNLKIKILAEQTGVDRASIYQYKNGKALPSKEFLNKFISVMQLSNSEENELLESYNIAKIGIPTYLKRKQLKRCMEILYDAITDNGQTGYRPSTAQITLPEHASYFEGREKIATLVKNVIDYEFALANEGALEVFIRTFIPADYTEFYQHLSELYHSHKGMSINFRPIICFNKNSNSEDNNIIDAFSSIMYFIFTDCPGYNPRFYYDDNNFMDSIGILYPYYIITTTHLILLDAKLSGAQLIVDQSVIQNFNGKFSEAFAKTKPLTQKFNKLVNVTQIILNKTQLLSSDCITCCAGSGGCYQKLADDQMIAKYVNLSKEDMEYVTQYIAKINDSSYIELQTSNGAIEFAKTGILRQIQSILTSKISIQDRKTLLETAKNNPEEMGYILDDSKIKIPPICMMIVKNDCVLMYIDIMSDMLMISEPEIANAFYDFFYSLIDSEYTMTTSEYVDNVIDEAIAICDEQLDQPDPSEN